MKFNLEKSIEILERTPGVLRNLLNGLSNDWTSQNEGENTWSPYDIIGHLIHGENTDWLPRTKIILRQGKTTDFEPYDRFAQFENSKGKSLQELLAEFKTLRKSNIAELKKLDIGNEELKLTGIHPEFGEVTLKQLLSAWVVHDLGHIVQISRVMAKLYKEESGPWIKYLKVLR
jgi:hypothetical protein